MKRTTRTAWRSFWHAGGTQSSDTLKPYCLALRMPALGLHWPPASRARSPQTIGSALRAPAPTIWWRFQDFIFHWSPGWPHGWRAASGGASAGMLYAALAGFGIPAQRACVMLTVVALALVLGRGAASSVVLAWALAAVVCIDPWAVTSAGFWLSFSAVAIILAAVRAQSGAAHRASPSPPFPPFAAGTAHSARKRLTRALRAARLKIVHSIRIQSAVSIGMIPFIAIWFSQISLISPLANLCAIPWFSFLITPLALIGAILPAPIDAYAFRAAHALLSGLIRILDILTAPSWALL